MSSDVRTLPTTAATAATAATATPNDVSVFERSESNVRLYSRTFPTVFARASGAVLHDESGRAFLDFFCGAGALNYGHNQEHIKDRLVEYLRDDGITHALDMNTTAKRTFLEAFDRIVLRPRGLGHRVQFCGPTGADAVEAALKLARACTGRTGIVSFMGGFHGMSRGALEVSGSRRLRTTGAIRGDDTLTVPYEDGPDGPFDSLALLERTWSDPSSGSEPPAAVIVEPVQMEGGVYPASPAWLAGLRDLTERAGVLLVLDEIQTGCGRTGTFFAFERAGIVPDMVTVSKSISGYGLPLSMLLIRPDLDDTWEPGDHTGTFRANQLALVAATAALDHWASDAFTDRLAGVVDGLGRAAARLDGFADVVVTRHAGAVVGVDLGAADRGAAVLVQRRCFENGLIVELAGRDDEVVKLMPPLTCTDAELTAGLEILRQALEHVLVEGGRS